MSYLVHLVFMFAVMALLAVSLDLLVGHLGLLCLCHSAFWAIGAYTTSILVMDTGCPFLLATVIGVGLAALCSQVIAAVAFRLRSEGIILASLALLLIVLDVLRNWRGLTGGLQGLAGVPVPELGGLALNGIGAQALFAVILLAAAVVIKERVVGSPLGLSLHAFRDDPLGALALGVRPSRILPGVVGLSAGIAAVAGAIYAAYASYINPAVFDQGQSILLLVMVLIGGAGTRWGPLFGAMFLVLIPEILRFSGLGSSEIGAMRQIFLGSCLLVFATYKPRGLVRGYVFK